MVEGQKGGAETLERYLSLHSLRTACNHTRTYTGTSPFSSNHLRLSPSPSSPPPPPHLIDLSFFPHSNVRLKLASRAQVRTYFPLLPSNRTLTCLPRLPLLLVPPPRFSQTGTSSTTHSPSAQTRTARRLRLNSRLSYTRSSRRTSFTRRSGRTSSWRGALFAYISSLCACTDPTVIPVQHEPEEAKVRRLSPFSLAPFPHTLILSFL